MEVLQQEIRMYGVRVYRAIQVTSTVEVVFDRNRVVVSQVVLHRQVRLVGVRVLEVLRHWETERLNHKRDARGQEVLVHPDRIRPVRIETLPIRQESERRRQATERALKDVHRVDRAHATWI